MSIEKVSSGQNTELAERLKLIMKRCHIKSQREFSQLAQLTDGYVSKLFRGAVDNLSKNAALSIERATGFNSNWILTGEGDQYSDQESPVTVVVGMEVMRVLNEMRAKAAIDSESTGEDIEVFKKYCREQEIPEEYLADPVEEDDPQELYADHPEFSNLMETLRALKNKDPKLSELMQASKAIRAKTPSSNQLKTAVAIKAISNRHSNDFRNNMFQSLRDPLIGASSSLAMDSNSPLFSEMKERVSELKDTISLQKKMIAMQEQEINRLGHELEKKPGD